MTALFWLAHLYYIFEAPLRFWLVMPLGSGLLAYLAWRSRSVTSTMVAHGVMNAMGDMVRHRLW